MSRYEKYMRYINNGVLKINIKKIVSDDINEHNHIWAIFKRAHQYYYASLVDMIGPNSDPFIKSLYENDDGFDSWKRFECMIFEIDDKRFRPMQSKYKMGISVFKDFCDGVDEDNLLKCIHKFYENFEECMMHAGYY